MQKGQPWGSRFVAPRSYLQGHATRSADRCLDVRSYGDNGVSLGVLYLSRDGEEVLSRTTSDSGGIEPADFELIFRGGVVGLGALGNVVESEEVESEDSLHDEEEEIDATSVRVVSA